MGGLIELARRIPRKRRPEDEAAEAAEVTRLLREQGWVAVQALALGGEVVLFVRDQKTSVPAEWRDAVRYTMAELEALAATPPTQEELQALHRLKRVFGGNLDRAEHGALHPKTRI